MGAKGNTHFGGSPVLRQALFDFGKANDWQQQDPLFEQLSSGEESDISFEVAKQTFSSMSYDLTIFSLEFAVTPAIRFWVLPARKVMASVLHGTSSRVHHGRTK